MVCPYAKSIKGVIVECAAAGRKVSALRYPCKGRYEKCPIYQRAKKAEEAKARAEPRPAVEAAQARQAPPPAPEPSAPQPQPKPPAPTAVHAVGEGADPNLLCDDVYRIELELARKAGSFVALDPEELRKIADTLAEQGHYVYIKLNHKGHTYEFLFDGKNLVSARVDGECRLDAMDQLPQGDVLIVEAMIVRKPPA